MAAGEITYDDHAADGYPYNPDDPADSAVLIYFVGSNSVSICKRPIPGRAERGVPYHTGFCFSCTGRCTTSTIEATAKFVWPMIVAKAA